MNERISKLVLIAGAIVVPLLLVGLAYFQPAYVSSQVALGVFLLFEILAAAVLMYRRAFLPLTIGVFLLAGMPIPLHETWTVVRWGILGVGALFGVILALREGRYPLGGFHLTACFAVMAALVSAVVSRYPGLTFLKVLSLSLLFVYTATGARIAAKGRENRFFAGLLLGCEVFVVVIAVLYLAGFPALGNPNSLGAVMAVVGAPILLWGTLVAENSYVRLRRLAVYGLSMYLTYASHSRASIGAALLTSGLLCAALRRYKLLAQGVVIIATLVATVAIFQPEAVSRAFSSVTFSILYKGADRRGSLLASRTSPWQDAVNTIRTHFWFGTGFGTSESGRNTPEILGTFSSDEGAGSTENGSSYLAVTTWVGMLGVLPFCMLLLILLRKIVQTVTWMFRTGNPFHPAVPLAMVMVAGLFDVAFEDWLFAPGYYLCVFYWSMAFIFVDVAPSVALADSQASSWSGQVMRQRLGDMAPSR